MKEYKEFTVVFELVADIMEKEKPISTARALRKAAFIYEKAAENPKAISIKPKDLTPDLLRKLAE